MSVVASRRAHGYTRVYNAGPRAGFDLSMDSMRYLRNVLVLLFCLLAASSCSAPPVLPKVRLVLFISVDQFWYPYLQRYGSHFSGGLRTLLDSAALFSNAQYEFAVTETCPGHATLVSGSSPELTGIIANRWYDRGEDAEVYCVEDEYYGRSPRSMRVTALPDWIKGAFSAGRVFSVSGKDRSAILMGGRKADGAFWYSRDTGRFVTSSFYELISSGWSLTPVKDIAAEAYFGTLWSPTERTALIFSETGGKGVRRGELEPSFPYPVGNASLSPNRRFYQGIYATPYIDRLTWDFARELLMREQLGTREDAMDYLALSFSALDSVGHTYGPDSMEALDTLLRLDTILKEVLQFIDEQVGLERTLVIVSSDHGVQQYPELANQERGAQRRRATSLDIACIQRAGQRIEETLAVQSLWKAPLVVDSNVLRGYRIPKTKVDAVVRDSLEDCAAVQRVWTRDELLFGPSAESPEKKLFRQSVTRDRGPDYYLQSPAGFSLSWPSGANHGSPSHEERHVPVFLLAEGISGAVISDQISMMDVAPTISALLGIEIPRFVEGQDRSKLLRPVIDGVRGN